MISFLLKNASLSFNLYSFFTTEKGYQEDKCRDVIENMKKCCQRAEARFDMRCSGFIKKSAA